MSSRRAPRRRINTPLAKGRQSTQRARLVEAMITVANRDGYARASVSAVIAEAGVSRPTFYDYFSDREDCLLAVISDLNALLLTEVSRALAAAPPAEATRAALRGLIGFASAEPAMAQFLTNSPMSCGGRALDARDAGIAAIERLIERAYASLDPATPMPDISARMLIGGLYRLLASRLRRGDAALSTILDDLLDWLARYELPLAEHRWRTLKPLSPAPPLPPGIANPLRAPRPLPRGRPRLSPEKVAENHRQRILVAVATLAETNGYNATTVADITSHAGLDSHAFYSLFSDKQDAFMAVHEVGFQQVMTVTAAAFFKGATWPERTWEAGRALAQFLQKNPLIAHVGFVEAGAVGPRAVQRVEDSHTAFTIFLQEGYQYAPQPPPPPRAALEAVITTLFETVYHQARRPGKPKLSGLLPHMIFLSLAPFLGPTEANRFIDQKLADGRGTTSNKRHNS
jgi:AcrR family transcriptional regulator